MFFIHPSWLAGFLNHPRVFQCYVSYKSQALWIEILSGSGEAPVEVMMIFFHEIQSRGG